MIKLPNESWLLDQIEIALEDISESGAPEDSGEFFATVVSEIAKRLQAESLRCYARGAPPPCVGSEWLFDFCALIPEPPQCADGFVAQAAVIGEIEQDLSRKKIDEDFEKLLIADALVCFFIFQNRHMDGAKAELDRFEAAVRRKHEYSRLRGLIRPPPFLLSSFFWNPKDRTGFLHRRVQPVQTG